MKKALVRSKAFERAWQRLPPHTQKLVNRKIAQLVHNPCYPSLNAHRLRRANATGIWECYISISHRLLYRPTSTSIYLLDVGEHRILDRI